MSDPERKMIEDRAVRDAALALVKADIAHLRADLTTKGIGERLLDRVAEGANDVLEEAVDVAENNRGVLITLVAAIVLWLSRNPLIALITGEEPEDEDGEEAEEPEGG